MLDHGLLVSVDPTSEDKERKLEVAIDRSLWRHDNFYHDEKTEITVARLSALDGIDEAAAALPYRDAQPNSACGKANDCQSSSSGSRPQNRCGLAVGHAGTGATH